MEQPFVETPAPSMTHTLRPMGIGDLLDRVIYFYRTHFVALLAFTSLLFLPVTLLNTLASLPTISFMSDPSLLEESPGLMLSSLGLTAIGSTIFSVILAYVIMPLHAGGVGVAMRGFLLEGRLVSFQEMVAGMKANARPLIGTGLVGMVFSALLSLTFILPPVGMAVMTLFPFAVYLAFFVTLYEKRQGLAALRRGWLLIRGSIWRAVGFLALLYFFSIVFGGIVGGLLGFGLALSMPDSPLATFLVQSLASGITQVLTMPLIFGTAALLYFDLRIRHEGLDVALAAAEAAGEPVELADLPVSEAPVWSEATWRPIGILAAVYTGVFVLLCGCIFLFAAAAGGLSSL